MTTNDDFLRFDDEQNQTNENDGPTSDRQRKISDAQGLSKANSSDKQLIEAQRPTKDTRASREAKALRKRQQDARSTYGRGREISLGLVKDKKNKARLRALESRFKETQLAALDAEILHEQQGGFLEAENALEKTHRVRQADILRDLPTQAAAKGKFELRLEDGLGPYTCDYTRNGKGLAIAGRKGHIATMVDWRAGKLGFELQLGETVRDVKWIANQNLAVAQKKYTYIYDHSGVEIHKLTKHIEVSHMEYLPYHYLLATLGISGYLKYMDVSTGQMVTECPTKMGTPTALRQNPWNAVLNVGHQNGTVSLWTPNLSEPIVKLQAHKGPVRSVAVDREGRYMVTCGQDQKMGVWDVRKFQPVHEYFLQRPGSSVSISDTGLAAIGFGTQISIWKGLFDKHLDQQEKSQRPYMAWGGEGQKIESVRWCPLEDILGVSHDKGLSNVVVPGAGEANFDALEVNPFESVKQRQESDVRGLLNKLQPETISMDPNFIGNVDLASPAVRRKEMASEKSLEQEIAQLRNRGRGRNSALRRALRKKGAKNIIDEKRLMLEEKLKEQKNRDKAFLEQKREDFGPALARFAR